jgi:hypothetical protein
MTTVTSRVSFAAVVEFTVEDGLAGGGKRIRTLGPTSAERSLKSGDERGFVGGEEQHPVGDLDRLADPWTL